MTQTIQEGRIWSPTREEPRSAEVLAEGRKNTEWVEESSYKDQL